MVTPFLPSSVASLESLTRPWAFFDLTPEWSVVWSNFVLPCDLVCTSWLEAADSSQVLREPPCLGARQQSQHAGPCAGHGS